MSGSVGPVSGGPSSTTNPPSATISARWRVRRTSRTATTRCARQVTLYARIAATASPEISFADGLRAFPRRRLDHDRRVKGSTVQEGPRRFSSTFHDVVDDADGQAVDGDHVGKIPGEGSPAGVFSREFHARVKCASPPWHTLVARWRPRSRPPKRNSTTGGRFSVARKPQRVARTEVRRSRDRSSVRVNPSPMSRPPVDLDSNVTTPGDHAGLERSCSRTAPRRWQHGSSSHAGREAQEAVEAARARVAAIIGASAAKSFSPEAATRVNNFAIHGVADRTHEGRRHIVVSAIEHKSVLESAHRLEHTGWAR